MSKFIVVRTSDHETNKLVPMLDNYKKGEGTVREFADVGEAKMAAAEMAANDHRQRTWMALEVLLTVAPVLTAEQTATLPASDENDENE